MVVKRFWHCGHCLLRLMAEPSSEVLESMTRESAWRQKGQNISAQI
jgi:hypothetical protein